MNLENMKILVVEDNEDLIVLWKLLFHQAGVKVTFTKTGKDALSVVYLGFVPDIIMTDYFLPDMTGADVIEEIRKMHPQTKALIVTGNSNSDFKSSLPYNTEFLLKPVRFEHIKEKLVRMKST